MIEVRQVSRAEAFTGEYADWGYVGLVPYPDDLNDDYRFERWLESRDDVILARTVEP